MLSLESILTYIHNGVAKQDPRFVVEGYEHVTDTSTGIMLHVYDKWFKVTYENDNIVTQDDFTKEERDTVWKIKELITPPDVLEKMITDIKPLQEARRAKFSALYENPTPMAVNAPVAEDNADIYMG